MPRLPLIAASAAVLLLTGILSTTRADLIISYDGSSFPYSEDDNNPNNSCGGGDCLGTLARVGGDPQSIDDDWDGTGIGNMTNDGAVLQITNSDESRLWYDLSETLNNSVRTNGWQIRAQLRLPNESKINTQNGVNPIDQPLRESGLGGAGTSGGHDWSQEIGFFGDSPGGRFYRLSFYTDDSGVNDPVVALADYPVTPGTPPATIHKVAGAAGKLVTVDMINNTGSNGAVDVYVEGQLVFSNITPESSWDGAPDVLFIGDCCGGNGAGNITFDFVEMYDNQSGSGGDPLPGPFDISTAAREWEFNASGDWNDAKNWLHSIIPTANTHDALFGNFVRNPQTIFTNSGVTVRSIEFDNVSVVVAGAGIVTLEADSGNASLNATQGSHEMQAAMSANSNVDVNVSAGATLKINNGLDLNGNDLVKTGAGDFQLNSQVTDAGNLTLLLGSLSGSSSMGGDLNNEGGVVSPGNSPGTMEVANFSQSVNGTLAIEIGGTEVGVGHDALIVDGTASLAGGLTVTLIDGFEPNTGETFGILDAGLILGEFDSVILPALATGFTWDSSALYETGTLSVVPEPATICGMAIFAILLCGFARRHQFARALPMWILALLLVSVSTSVSQADLIASYDGSVIPFSTPVGPNNPGAVWIGDGEGAMATDGNILSITNSNEARFWYDLPSSLRESVNDNGWQIRARVRLPDQPDINNISEAGPDNPIDIAPFGTAHAWAMYIEYDSPDAFKPYRLNFYTDNTGNNDPIVNLAQAFNSAEVNHEVAGAAGNFFIVDMINATGAGTVDVFVNSTAVPNMTGADPDTFSLSGARFWVGDCCDGNGTGNMDIDYVQFFDGVGGLPGAYVQAPREWLTDGSNDWNNASNWSNTVTPNADIDEAIFGSAITSPQTVLTNSSVVAKTITFDNSQSYIIAGQGSVISRSDTGVAAVNVVSGSHQIQAAATIQSPTTVDVSAGATLAYNNMLTLNDLLTKTGDGVLQINNKQAAGGNGVEVQAGTLEGSGNVSGNVFINGGSVAPGKSVGTLTVEGSMTQSGSGSIALEIGGLSPGDQHDRLVLTGDAVLNSTVAVELIGGFNPAMNDSFDVLDFGTMPNLPTFNFDLALLDSGLMWDTSTFMNDGVLSVANIGGGNTDYDDDGTWNLGDLNLVLFNWQVDGGSLDPQVWFNSRPPAGMPIGLTELNQVLFNWQLPASLAVVPEPGTLVLLGMALIGLIGYHVRR